MGIKENLKKYFKNNPKEKIKKDWEGTKKWDESNSPLIKEFLDRHNCESK